MPELDVDLSCFSYSGKDVPWGQEDTVATLTLAVGVQTGLHITRFARQGTWDIQLHGLRIPMPTNRDPNRYGCIGLSGFVRASSADGNRLQDTDGGFVLEARCAVHDEDAMRFLLLAAAAARVEEIQAAMVRIGADIQTAQINMSPMSPSP